MSYIFGRSLLLVGLVCSWIFTLGVESSKTPPSCSASQQGGIRATPSTGQSNGNCVIVNLTNIEVCERDGWREICDEEFTDRDVEVTCRELGYSDIGAGADTKTDQFPGGFVSTEYPQCSGQESKLSECPMTSRGSGPYTSMCGVSTESDSSITSSTTIGEPFTTTTHESVHNTTSSVQSIHKTTPSSSEHITSTRDQASDTSQLNQSDPALAIIISSCISGFFIILAALITIILLVLCLCRRSRLKYSRRCSQFGDCPTETDITELCLYSELMDNVTDSEHLQDPKEETPLYETITNRQVRISAQVDGVELKDNLAYESLPADRVELMKNMTDGVELNENLVYDSLPAEEPEVKENLAYGTLSEEVVEVKENLTYGSLSEEVVEVKENLAYGSLSEEVVEVKENLAYESLPAEVVEVKENLAYEILPAEEVELKMNLAYDTLPPALKVEDNTATYDSLQKGGVEIKENIAYETVQNVGLELKENVNDGERA